MARAGPRDRGDREPHRYAGLPLRPAWSAAGLLPQRLRRRLAQPVRGRRFARVPRVLPYPAPMAAAGQREQAAAAAARAETAARSIAGPGWQGRVLVAVAGALAGTGQREQAAAAAARAETAARSITDPDRQAQALAAVAEALAATGNRRLARHVASAACAVGWWTTVLGVVLSLEPSAVRAVRAPESGQSR